MINNYFLYCELLSIFLLIDFAFYLPLKNIFFGSYLNSNRKYSREILIIIFILWLICLISILLDFHRLLFSFILIPIFRYYFISTRWSSLLRGGGAPGYMSYYSLLIILLSELSFILPTGNHVWLGYLIMLDFGTIILCSGIYKSLSGYLKSDGMEYGLANPMWSYFFKYFSKISPNNTFFKVQNYTACLLQIFAGLCILLSPINVYFGFIGGTIVFMSFLYLIPLVRLGRLATIMMSISILFIPDLKFSLFSTSQSNPQTVHIIQFNCLNDFFKIIYLTYLPLLVIIKFTQYLNLFKNIYWSHKINSLLSKIANFFPVIIWRVFTPDVTNFYIKIKIQNKIDKSVEILDENNIYSYFTNYSFWNKFRFLHVMESIALTNIFNSLRYFKNNQRLFIERLLRYSKTFPNHTDKIITYDYILIEKTIKTFEYKLLKSFIVDTKNGSINSIEMNNSELISKSSTYSPVHVTNGFGHY